MGASALGGLVGSAAAFAVAQQKPQPGWIVVPTQAQADRWLRALRFYLKETIPVLPYPADDCPPFEDRSPSPEIPRQRLLARARPDALIVAPARALLLKVPPLEQKLLQCGQSCDRSALLRWLVAWGYLRTQEPDEPGSVCVRGETLILWPPELPDPVRVEWDDDLVERIRVLPSDGSPPIKLQRLNLLPMREFKLDAQTAEQAAAYLHQRAAYREQGPDRRRLLEDLREGHSWSGGEVYRAALMPLMPLPAISGFCYEYDQVLAELFSGIEEIRQRFTRLPEKERPYVLPEDLYLSAPPPLPAQKLSALVHPLWRDAETTSNTAFRLVGAELAPLVRTFKTRLQAGVALTVVAESKLRAERIQAILEGYGLKFGDGRAKAGQLGIEIGDLPEGFSSAERVFLTAAEIFGDRLSEAPPPTAARRLRRAAVGFANLKRGDPVVHARHGLGLYQGLARMPLGETEGDFVILTYRDNEKLYLPVHRLDQLSPWRGIGSDGPPPLDRLGGSTWELRKAKVRDNLLALAHQLLETEARRKIHAGRAFRPPGELYHSFEAAFPYQETPDQLSSIAEVLADLEQAIPMDRLLVGDVGFGKTEVAMRAAFRAVEEGLQVAVLCPTSLLTWQHTESFRKRFAEFPIRIEGIWGGTENAEAKATLEATAKGHVDILIGTHRLLGRNTRFAQLGLVVVDEEHRFGVRQKEQLKRLAAGVHYLALSATPIPRSLQLALSGLRALSALTAPPLGRKPIRTEVMRHAPGRVAEEIRTELARNGQVFFVHNRVQSIQGIARWLQKQVPEARIGLAHGQMEASALEKAMLSFSRRETDILVCTTIIESGIDLPQVNCMLINRADQLGLAQLYQLRGRIGRSDIQARCTLLVSQQAAARKAAMERLSALQEASALGSGMMLASRDLELRGSGDLLGEKQHGSITAIGFDAYTELLSEAVARLRGQAQETRLTPELEVPVPTLIPEDFVEDLGERLEAYRLLSDATREADIQAVLRRLEQRHGRLPEPVDNLRRYALCRLQMRQLWIEHCAVLKIRLLLRFHARCPIPTDVLLGLCKNEPGRFRLSPEGMLAVHFTPQEGQDPLRQVEWALGRLNF